MEILREQTAVRVAFGIATATSTSRPLADQQIGWPRAVSFDGIERVATRQRF